MTQMKTPDCNICYSTFDNFELLNKHMQNAHQETDNDRMIRLAETFQSARQNEQQEKVCITPKVLEQEKQKEEAYICELCDKNFPNRVQKSNHKLLVHTVREERLPCDYCDEIYIGLKNFCKHMSSKHSQFFSKRSNQDNKCYICYIKLASSEEMSTHMEESHSPDSFYEKLIEEISGESLKNI